MDNYWTIHGKKYDLRKFIERHPGGQDTILITQGKDCTELLKVIIHLLKDTDNYWISIM